MANGRERKKILVIEDDLEQAARLVGVCAGIGFEVRVESESGRAADQAFRWRPDIIALNIKTAGLAGRDVLCQLQSRPQTSRIPVLLMSEGDLPADFAGRDAHCLVNNPRILEGVVDGLRKLAEKPGG